LLYSTKYIRVTTPISPSVSLLEHFEEAINSLQADNVTASLVIPATLGIDCMLAMWYAVQYFQAAAAKLTAEAIWWHSQPARICNSNSTGSQIQTCIVPFEQNQSTSTPDCWLLWRVYQQLMLGAFFWISYALLVETVRWKWLVLKSVRLVAWNLRRNLRSKASSPDLYQHQYSHYLTGVRITNTSRNLCFQMLIQPSTGQVPRRNFLIWLYLRRYVRYKYYSIKITPVKQHSHCTAVGAV